ncbi:hypothetical protein [Streptomyces sp. NEAU-174]|uniref:hypothetical protein n=1 Tax=Streptomyces sp. NEAU-174 TaxID=3458254 RepID=UPI0040444EA9
MDLQGIGALAAAAVAALGIPAAVLVGRWQLRAALRGAEVASQAGLAQAEATYRAALDQAAAQNSADDDQWRRGIRRDAWSAFLLSVEDVVKSSEAAFSGADVDLDPGLRSVQTAFVVLELEGPAPIVAAAERLVQRCNDLCELCDDDRPAHARGKSCRPPSNVNVPIPRMVTRAKPSGPGPRWSA